MRKNPTFSGKSGLPKRFERRLQRHYGRTPTGRVKLAAALGALGVLVRHHPKVMLSMIGAGAIQAARAGVRELTGQVGRLDKPGELLPTPNRRRPLRRGEARRFRKFLDSGAPLPEQPGG